MDVSEIRAAAKRGLGMNDAASDKKSFTDDQERAILDAIVEAFKRYDAIKEG